jgi:tRNA G18 (ribose-2'-O)-methylase SpoU
MQTKKGTAGSLLLALDEGGGRPSSFSPLFSSASASSSGGGGGGARRSKQSVIVIASLVSNAPNLAGIARTAEIFGASRVVVSSLSLLKGDDFKKIAVSAGEHLSFHEVAVAGLRPFCKQLRARGFTVVALEQTSHSLPLHQLRGHAPGSGAGKIAVVLGREKEGVPVDLLEEVDVCVEIPQQGVLRSLNVHVSAALFLWELTRARLQDQDQQGQEGRWAEEEEEEEEGGGLKK